MNIAIVIPTLGTGGAERSATELGKYLNEKGSNVYYFLLSNSGKVFFDIGGEVVKTHITYPFTGSNTVINIREMLFAARELKKIKVRYSIDISISFMEGCNVLNILSMRRGERTIISVRTVLSERREYDGVFLYDRRLISMVYPFANKIVAVSDGVKEDLVNNYGINVKNIMTIPNVSERRVSCVDSTPSAWSYGDRAVVCVGRMDPVKQFDCVLRAFSVTHRLDFGARLVFVGDGRQMNHMKALRRELGLDDVVVFAGFQKDIGAYLTNARCFVMTSKAEGFPNAMVEAMAYGVPVISTDSPGGCREIIGRNHKITDITYCKYGVMTPYIHRNGQKDSELTIEEELLGKAMYRVLSDKDLNYRYAEMSGVRSRYYCLDNVMSMWKNVLEV